MSLLERIKLIEDAIIELSDHHKIYLEVLEEVNGKLDRLLAVGSARQTEKKERCVYCSGSGLRVDKNHIATDCSYCRGTGIGKASGDNEFICGNCGKRFKAYHDGQGINTGFCPKCLTEYDTGGGKEEVNVQADRHSQSEQEHTNSKLPEARIHSPGFEDYKPKKENTETEEVEQDFSQVTVMNQTPLALLVVKKGYQQWLARQFIKNPLELGYQNANMYNIELKEKSDKGKPISWLLKKWKPFEVFKD